ncbi:MAG: cation transporter [Euryhalocaulis sp.]|uniref:cation transporter n=1 Tax=Euryhalocaulis sp. TaxID=2744307 RepID=UPI001833EF41|nr:cation transporter [Euryhalocaulis sp.]MBA4801361.1 cation transporter [Euryhalocaulis sp.]
MTQEIPDAAAGCCEAPVFEGASKAYRTALTVVIAINGLMFVVEMAAGFVAGSMALKADALDFAADTATYAMTFLVIGRPATTRARAALIKGGSLAVMAGVILVMTLVRTFSGETPAFDIMAPMGLAALLANAASVLILLRWRDGDANVRSVWVCSRNDMIGNIGVLIAAGLVAMTGSIWPDLVIAALLAGLFLRSSITIFRLARAELNEAKRRETGCETS